MLSKTINTKIILIISTNLLKRILKKFRQISISSLSPFFLLPTINLSVISLTIKLVWRLALNFTFYQNSYLSWFLNLTSSIKKDQKINTNAVARFNGNIRSDIINFKNEFLDIKLEILKFLYNLDSNVIGNIDSKFYYRIEFFYIKNKVNYIYFFALKNFGDENSEIDKIRKFFQNNDPLLLFIRDNNIRCQ
jgi:hypothetical protein